MIKKYKFHIFAFLIPFVIYLLFFAWKGCFTDKTILNADMRHQYQNLFQYLHDFLHGQATFPYTFSKGLGGGMYGSYFYYLASPINLLVYFFEDIPLFLTLLVILKLSLSGLTMYIFLNKKSKGNKYHILFFSLAYACMGYNINYFSNVMWLDGVVFAPLLLASIDRIVQKKGDLLYRLILFFCIFSNYYIGYILTIFSVIYFFYSYYLLYRNGWKEEKKLIGNFLLTTFLTGLLTSFILLPCGLELLNTNRVSSYRFINWNILDFIAPTYLGFGNLVNPLNYYGFFIFCGTSMIPLILCYFCNKKIDKREKYATIIVYLFFLLPIIFQALNCVWHMFSYPMGYNYRYSFLATLFSIMICCRSLEKLEIKKRTLMVYFIIYIIGSISVWYATNVEPDYYIYINGAKIIVTILLVALNLWLLFRKKKNWIMLVLVVELIGNLIWIGSESKMLKNKDYYEAKQKIREFSTYCEKNQRCETKISYTLNDSLLANYSGITTFLSTSNGKVNEFLQRASNQEKLNYYAYHVDLLLDTLLGINIIELSTKIDGYTLEREYPFRDDLSYLYRNPYALSLGYLVSPKIKNFDSKETGAFFLQDVLNAMMGKEKEYLLKLPIKKISDKKYYLEKDKTYPYLYIFGDSVPTINEEEITDFLYSTNDYQMILDQYGDTLTFEFSEKTDSFEVYTLNLDALQELRQNMVEIVIDENSQNKIIGHIEAKENSVLFLSIPYEKGFSITVDSKKVDYYEALDSFLAIDLEKGSHTISLEYHIYGLKLGVLISIISFFLLLIRDFRNLYMRKLKKEV